MNLDCCSICGSACRVTFDMTSYMKECKNLHPQFFPDLPFYPKVDVVFNISSSQVWFAWEACFSEVMLAGRQMVALHQHYVYHLFLYADQTALPHSSHMESVWVQHIPGQLRSLLKSTRSRKCPCLEIGPLFAAVDIQLMGRHPVMLQRLFITMPHRTNAALQDLVRTPSRSLVAPASSCWCTHAFGRNRPVCTWVTHGFLLYSAAVAIADSC